MSFILV